MYDENWTRDPRADDPLPFDEADHDSPLNDDGGFGGIPDGADSSPLRTEFEETEPAPDMDRDEAGERLEDLMEKDAMKEPAPQDPGHDREQSRML